MTQQQANVIMRKPIELWQFIISLMALIMTAGVMIVNQSNKIQSQGDRIFFLEQTTTETKVTLKEMSVKLTDILLALKDKKDRDSK